MKRTIPPAVAISAVVVALLAVGAILWARTSSSPLGVSEQKFEAWKQKMQAATPRPGTRITGQPTFAGSVIPPPHAAAGQH